jgi:hypothetical protein
LGIRFNAIRQIVTIVISPITIEVDVEIQLGIFFVFALFDRREKNPLALESQARSFTKSIGESTSKNTLSRIAVG